MTDKTKSGKLISNLIGFIETKIELLKLDIQEEISGILAKIIILLVIILLFTGVLIFASLTLATYLNGLFSSTFIGYAILSGIFLILILIAVPSRKNKKIQQKISQLLNKYFNEKGD